MAAHRAKAMSFAIAMAGFVLVNGCLTLTTTQEGSAGGNGGMGSSSGTGVDCTSIENCPAVSICGTMSCVNGKCVTGFVISGTQCNTGGFCDGKGSCVECVANKNCSGDNATCENNQCISCNDGIQNGTETGVDCGGTKCAACSLSCTTNMQCASGYCVDGVCCDAPCTDVCKSCNLTNKVGKCSTLASGTEDPGQCDTTKACSGFTAKCLLKNGQACVNDTECLSHFCINGSCSP